MRTTGCLVGALAAASLGCFAADVKTDGTWYNFKTVAGQDFGGGPGFASNHTSFEPLYYNPGAPPWTFTAPAGGVKLTVVDGGEIGDVYNVWDNGVLIGVTSPPIQPFDQCGGEPVPCLNHPRVSKGEFQLGAGPHSVTFSIQSTPYPNSFVSWFRVEAGSGGQTSTPVISNVISAAGGPNSVQPFIQAGSWVTIYGSNFSTSTATWAGLINNGQLPTSVGGVSVTIDGQPAYVYFVSPTQINVQAPSTRTGSVQVVVRNGAGSSAPATVEARTYAPAFFQWDPQFIVATRHPDYRLIGPPSLGASYSGIRRGEIAVLWATGFGPVSPSVLPGVLPSVAGELTEPPTVILGGIQVSVVGAAMTPGLVGLYQIAIQIPSNVATGNIPIEAMIGGATTPAGTHLYIVE